jgi:hypothetical protein
MLRLAPGPSDKERLLEELYPGREFLVAEWEKCLTCDKDVDAYIYVAGMRRGYCNDHYNITKSHLNAE